MSEEKLYAVKNDEGKYWDFEDQDGFWELNTVGLAAIADEECAKCVAHDHGGHVVTFVEESKKVVLSEEQAKIVEDANKYKFPASYISMNTDDYDGLEKLLMEAYVNGYTVAKEKKYLVYKDLGGKQDKENDCEIAQAYRSSAHRGTMFWVLTNEVRYDPNAKLTEKEISDFGLQDCEKEEVTDDDE